MSCTMTLPKLLLAVLDAELMATWPWLTSWANAAGVTAPSRAIEAISAVVLIGIIVLAGSVNLGQNV